MIFRIIALQFDQSNPALCPLRTEDTRSRFSHCHPEPQLLNVFQLFNSCVHHLWLPDLAAPAWQHLGGVGVAGQVVGELELAQQCPGAGEEEQH